MLKKWKSLSFTTKLVFVNVVSILCVVLLVTFTQVEMFISVSEEESISNLNMLTNQVTLNFGENQENISDTVYARATTFEIPSLMETAGKQSDLKYALAQMVTNSTAYNYVMIELADGKRIDSGSKYIIETEELSVIRKNCNMLLDTYKENTHGSSSWYRCDDDDIYILKDVYDTMPLSHVGRMVVHLKDEPYKISDVYTDNMFLFFDKNGEYLTYAGVPLFENAQEKVHDFVKENKSYAKLEIDGETILVAKYTKDSWTTVGISTMERYKHAEEKITRQGILFGIIGVCLGAGLVVILLSSVVRKLKQLQESMNEVAKGGLGYQLPVTGEDDISQLSISFNYMSNRIAELLEELIQKERAKKNVEIEMLEYKYRSLQTQIRPHFIYNALECIGALAKMRRYAEIEQSVQRISRYFRNITVNTKKQFITVEQEFNSLRDYTEIYGFIHGNNLKATYSAREQAKNAMVPTMLVQPLVENALKYGIRSSDEVSEIIIHAYKKDENLCITIKDSGYGLSKEVEEALLQNQRIPSNEKEGIGLSNVKERLQLLYGEAAQFDIRNRGEGGVVAKIVIPFSYSEPDSGEADVLEELEDLKL